MTFVVLSQVLLYGAGVISRLLFGLVLFTGEKPAKLSLVVLATLEMLVSLSQPLESVSNPKHFLIKFSFVSFGGGGASSKGPFIYYVSTFFYQPQQFHEFF